MDPDFSLSLSLSLFLSPRNENVNLFLSLGGLLLLPAPPDEEAEVVLVKRFKLGTGVRESGRSVSWWSTSALGSPRTPGLEEEETNNKELPLLMILEGRLFRPELLLLVKEAVSPPLWPSIGNPT